MAGVLRARLGTTASLCKFFAAATTGGQAGFCMRDLAVFEDGKRYFYLVSILIVWTVEAGLESEYGV